MQFNRGDIGWMRQLEQPGQESRDITWTMLDTKHPPSLQVAVSRMSLTYRFIDLVPRMSSEALIQGGGQSRVLNRVVCLLIEPIGIETERTDTLGRE